jgi:SAM-dependent methyltransferase
MALTKILRTLRQQGLASTWRKVAHVAPGYLGGIAYWRVGRCQCCNRLTIFLAQKSSYSELRSCLFCSANERYELLATEIKHRFGQKLSEMNVLELDPKSPLNALLSGSRKHVRSFYEEGCTVKQKDGALCEDITALSFENDSFDLIVSSEVLEHVPQLDVALSETARVLKPGGVHLFTVPPRAMTKRRAILKNGKVEHIEPPEYHRDPLSPDGILAFWDIGPDLPTMFPTKGLDIRIVRGPVGDAGRVVWIAERVA